jgi:hypothetical protein
MPEDCSQCAAAGLGTIHAKYQSDPNTFVLLCQTCYDVNLFSETLLEIGDIYTILTPEQQGIV